MVPEELDEGALVGRLVVVVELLGDAGPQLLRDRGHLEAGEGEAERPEQQIGVAEVGGDGLGHAGVLDLDRDGDALAGDGAVHLADGSGGDGLRIPLGEQRFGCVAELRLDHRGGEPGGHRRRVGLQL